MSTAQFIRVTLNADFIINIAHIIYLERKDAPGNFAPTKNSDTSTNPVELPYLIDIALVRTTVTWGFHTKEERDARFGQLQDMMHPVTLPKLPNGTIKNTVLEATPGRSDQSSSKRSNKKPTSSRTSKVVQDETTKSADDLT
ncbi:hypothetical protein [Hymenobacter fodinae]|uniref:Uncharacterized protein n=1 Tax=Hymenobacter fodinae TaxID=2510796 RepID=A0A4Z0P0N8_9BACT|nr:hypothetical protein [Hymenobacter fodinae]TGE03323.1 hypothetical protein EU556_25745 [Hymenobacter fodinae]